MEKPNAPAVLRNQAAILEIIQPLLQNTQTLLEFGSGTGQHAVHFAQAMPWLRWQTTDLSQCHEGIQAWLNEANLANTPAPLEWDVFKPNEFAKVGAVFTANTLHIISEKGVEAFFEQLKVVLEDEGQLLVYGPFNYNGEFTSESNANFEQWLKGIDPLRGIRDIEWVQNLAEEAGLSLIEDYTMPANNRLLHFLKNRQHLKTQ